MTDGPAGTVYADDGTPLEFTWVTPDAPGQRWRRDVTHYPHPLPPMECWLYENGWAGADRAWEEAGLLPFFPFHRFQLVGPFFYIRQSPERGERGEESLRRLVAVSREHGGPLAFWQDFCAPRMQQVLENTLRDPISPERFRQIAESWLYAWHQTYTSFSMLLPPQTQLEQMVSVAGGDASVAHDLIAGGENPNQRIDNSIWELADSVRGSEVADRLRAGEQLDAIKASPEAADFVRHFERLVSEHEDRSFEWSLIGSTWGERPETVLDLIRACLKPGARAPSTFHRAAAARREALIADVTARIEPGDRERFGKLLRLLEGYVTIREERSYVQMVLAGRTRRRLLEFGDTLVDSGRLARREDILFVTPDSIAHGRSLRAEVDRARAEWEHWSRVDPPAWVGESEPAGGEEPAADEKQLDGVAASAGVVTGPARVVLDPFELTDLAPGEILVCVTTTPAWTPLIAMAAGLVTETGGATSHPAITCREYGIPCVASARDATARITSGQTITVDGNRGVVAIGE